jgi:UDP-glucose 4-epimerase
MGTALIAAAAASGHDVVSIDVSPAGPGPAGGKPQDKPPGRVIELTADATSYEQLKGALRGCDAVVHLAGRPAPVPWPAHEVHNTNVVANYNALCVAVELGVEHVCLASSINAVGAAFSRRPRFDYFPLDEAHPTYNEDPYSLSKWICEAQADSVSRRHANLTIGSLRLHHLVPMRALKLPSHYRAALHRELWGYTTFEAAARACLAVLSAPWKGHETFFVVAPRLALDEPTMALCDEFFPEVPLRRAFVGNEGLFSCKKASDMLGWEHDIQEGAT